MAIVQVDVQGLMLDPYNQTHIVLLKGREGEEVLPIWVGPAEANAIGTALEGATPSRPMTHDLLDDAIETLGARTLSVVINDLRDNTFYAKVHLLKGEGEVTVDARPSDAIALALRAECPVFVDTEVFHKSQSGEVSAWLENLKPEDFNDVDESRSGD
jgi:bifunctional DNase/RNase